MAAFLEGRIGFLDIAATVETVIDRNNVAPVRSLDDVRAADTAARGQERSTLQAGWPKD